MALYDYPCHVVGNRPCGPDLWILTLKATATNKDNPPFVCQAGQFVMVDLPEPAFHFRRPFSVLDIHPDGSFDLYYKVVGYGTGVMAHLKPGDRLNVLGSLGRSFTPPQPHETCLLIGGGIGIAPLYLLAREWQRANQKPPTCFYGVRSEADIGLHPELIQTLGSTDRLHIATDDGSYGFHGNVCQLMATHHIETIQSAHHAYVCGPNPMMAATVAQLHAMNTHLHVQVSLENPMPCGTGACFGCVVALQDQDLPSRTCIDGPVYDANTLIWEAKGPRSSPSQSPTPSLPPCPTSAGGTVPC